MLSVLISTYKADNSLFLHQALTSIYDDQTLKPSQIVLVKDGPLTNDLDTVIDEWKVKLGEILSIVSLVENVGLGAALNEGLNYCQYDLIARMDSDDLSLPDRFSTQVEFMNNFPDIAASSATIQEFDEDLSNLNGFRRLPNNHNDILLFSKRRSPLNHMSSIYRKSIIMSVGGYPPLKKAQDYALWSVLIVNGYKLANLDTVLAYMRAGDGLISRRGWKYFKEEYKLLKYQKKIGFLSTKDFLINTSLKACLRIAPNYIKRLAYRFVR